MSTAPIFRLLDVQKSYDVDARGGSLFSRAKRRLRALDGVRLSLAPGESLAIVGESGSGKTTLLRVLLGLTHPTDGRALFREKDIASLEGGDRDRFCREVAMIYQDARGSLNPRMSVLDLIAEPLDHHKLCTKSERSDRVATLMSRVGLSPGMMSRYIRRTAPPRCHCARSHRSHPSSSRTKRCPVSMSRHRRRY